MTDIDAHDLTRAGWDLAAEGFAPEPERNPHRLRLWRQSRRLTWLAAGVQLLPLLIVLFGDVTPLERLVVGVLVPATTALALAPWLCLNLVNLFYPVLLCLVCWADLGGVKSGDVAGLMDLSGQFFGHLFYSNMSWESWLLRLAIAGAVAQIAFKAIQLSRGSALDRAAIRIWWRPPHLDAHAEEWI